MVIHGHTPHCSQCVACGELHDSANCPSSKGDPRNKRCSNCGVSHTGNYGGCTINNELNSRIHQLVTTPRSANAWFKPSRSSFDFDYEASTRKNVTFTSALKSGFLKYITLKSTSPRAKHDQTILAYGAATKPIKGYVP